MKEFIIDKNGDGLRLDKFMARVLPMLGTGGIYKALRKKKVRVCGKHRDGAFRLSEGDNVCIYLNDELFESEREDFPWIYASDKIDVVYEDDNIIVADKPSGMPSQDGDNSNDSLESRIRSYLYKKGEIRLDASPLFIPSLCHRLDRNTEGIVLAAKNAAAQRIINDKIKNREIRKLYLCKTEHMPKPASGEINGYLLKDGKERKMIFSEKKIPGAVFCSTIYKVVKKGEPALVEAELKTGRTHQIRAAFAHIGCPLCGDVKYGAQKEKNGKYQCLCAYKLIFCFNEDAKELEYLNGKTIEKHNILCL